MKRFEGHNIVVTGGASGIGEATVKAIVAEGGSVIIADLQQDKGQTLAAELGSQARFHHTDVTRETDIAAAIELAEREFGPSPALLTARVLLASQVPSAKPVSMTMSKPWPYSAAPSSSV